MNKELKAKWVEALRSGKYQKCVGFTHLYLDNGEFQAHCALGVLDLVACQSHASSSDIGFEHNIPDYIGNRIIQMNDKENKTFPEIADYIESEL